jgi:ABC-2 type transport system permease protein
MAMAALGGCWWPLEIVSKPLQTFALLMPSGWAMKALHETISFGRGLDGVAVPVAVLLGFGVVFTVVAAKSLRLE